jgi:ketosteroid isomerase-like protein
MHAHQALVTRFYEAFQRRDAEAMVACYHPDVRFSDPVFQDLRGELAGRMWRMLCARAKDFKLAFSHVDANDTTGTAKWEAHYTFSATGRHVHNIIAASFTFVDGRIHTHSDVFDLHRWAGQALGLKGVLLGWAPPVQNAIRKQARAGLDSFDPSRVRSA